MNKTAESHLDTAAAFIAAAESADAKRTAYEKAADEILAAQTADSSLTQEQIGATIGKSRSWVSTLLGWRQAPDTALPFARDWDRRKEQIIEGAQPSKLTADRLADVITAADPKEAKAAIKDVMTTGPTKHRIAVDHGHHEAKAEQRRKERERAKQRAKDKALPLPAYMARMVEKMNEWSAGLAGLYDDLDELPEGRGLELVGDAAAELARQAQRWVDRIEQRARPELRVIEGKAAS